MVDAVKYVTAYPPARALRLLEVGVTKESVAEECRQAALAFLSGVASGWDKLDLVLWLTGPYARATRHAPRGERVVDVAHTPTEIADASIEELVTRVRGQVLASLEKAALDYGRLDFADDALQRGLVRKAMDEEGAICFVPVDAPHMRLRDRVRALFAADYLCAPHAYVDLFVCHRCESVSFDEHAKEIGVCRRHRISGVVPRNDIERKATGTP